jgi:LemA protein
MKKGLLIGIVVVVVLGVIALELGGLVAATYNSLIQKRVAVENQWANVETQYQRRFDLIPNLVAATKGYLKQELTIFKMITEARTKYARAGTVDEKVAAVNQLETALGRLLAIIEDNPEIKSDQVVIDLMYELTGTENRISVERTRYNERVQEYNTTIKMFPTMVVAGILGFQEKPFFVAQAGAEEAPEVELEVQP